jgi:hypothetical protein
MLEHPGAWTTPTKEVTPWLSLLVALRVISKGGEH